MSMETVNWDLEERVEDALVAYLKNCVTEAAMIIPAFDVRTAKYPLVVVIALDSDNKEEDESFTGRRLMNVEVVIVTEALNLNGMAGSEAKNLRAREHHRRVKNSIIGWLAGNEIQDDVNAMGEEGVDFSMIFMEGQSRDAGDGKLTTTQTLKVIAQPKELG
jgi:hypothetical protein